MSDELWQAAWILSFGFATGHGDTIEDLLSEAGTQIQELRAAQEWVSVNKGLPQTLDAVWISDSSEHDFPTIGRYDNSSEYWEEWNYATLKFEWCEWGDQLTVWMPLPTPPAQEDK